MGKVIKIILVIVIIMVIICIAGMIFISSYSRINKKELAPKETILKGTTNKKALVLYQNTKHETGTNITMAVAKELQNLGYIVVINHPSSKLTYDVSEYDVLAFGSGVYMGTVSEPLKAYMDKTDFTGKNVIVYAIGSNTEETAEIEQLKSNVKNAAKLGGIKVKKGEESKIRDFIQQCVTQ